MLPAITNPRLLQFLLNGANQYYFSLWGRPNSKSYKPILRALHTMGALTHESNLLNTDHCIDHANTTPDEHATRPLQRLKGGTMFVSGRRTRSERVPIRGVFQEECHSRMISLVGCIFFDSTICSAPRTPSHYYLSLTYHATQYIYHTDSRYIQQLTIHPTADPSPASQSDPPYCASCTS